MDGGATMTYTGKLSTDTLDGLPKLEKKSNGARDAASAPKLGGLRYDKGKNRLELIDASFIEELGKVMTFGAEKYDDDNWRKGMEWRKVIGCMKRHASKFEQGVSIDEESGCHHLALVAANAMFLWYYETYNKGLDNRIINGTTLEERNER
jgi:hypothetical protein